MDKEKTRVGVLMGGLSAEREISVKTGHGVAGALRELGWNVVEVPIDRNADKAIRESEINVAWIALHGKFGEDGSIQGLLEVMGIPYTGSGVQASAICMDKVVTKHVLRRSGMPMPKDVLYMGGNLQSLEALDYPMVVKPRAMGSSLGVTLVHNRDELGEAIIRAWGPHGKKEKGALLIEAFVLGEEITVPVLNGLALPAVRILPKDGQSKLFNFTAKYEKNECVFECPANISSKSAEEAEHLAMVAYHNLGCRGLARADFIVNKDGHPVFLEINTIPGMTATSLSPMSAATTGMDYGQLCEQILLSATCEEEEPARSA